MQTNIKYASTLLYSTCCAVSQRCMISSCEWCGNAVFQIYPGAKEEPLTGLTSSGLFFSCSADSTVRMWSTEPQINPANSNLLSSVSLLFISVIHRVPVTHMFAHSFVFCPDGGAVALKQWIMDSLALFSSFAESRTLFFFFFFSPRPKSIQITFSIFL